MGVAFRTEGYRCNGFGMILSRSYDKPPDVQESVSGPSRRQSWNSHWELRNEESCRHCQASIKDSHHIGGLQRDKRDLMSSSIHVPLVKNDLCD